MTVLFRTLFVWLLLLAIPYQGYASATMLLCAQMEQGNHTSASASVVAHGQPAVHDHAAMMAAAAHSAHAGGNHASQAADGSSAASSAPPHHHDGKSAHCSGAACCAAVATAFVPAMTVPVLTATSSAVPFYSAYLPAVDLAHPERPPQGAHA